MILKLEAGSHSRYNLQPWTYTWRVEVGWNTAPVCGLMIRLGL